MQTKKMERITSVLLFWVGIGLWLQTAHTCASEIADHEMEDGFNEMSLYGGDKIGGIGTTLKCKGAKCECPNNELKDRFYRTVGHVVANCRLNKAHRVMLLKYRMKMNLFRDGLSPPSAQTGQYELHDDACQIMKLIGEYQRNGYFDNEVNSCCDYREKTITFQYDIAEYLEVKMAEKCDKIFKSPSLLIKGIKSYLEGMENAVALDTDNPAHQAEGPDETGDFGEGAVSETDEDGTKLGKFDKLGNMLNANRKPIEGGKDDIEDNTDTENRPKTGKGGRKGDKSKTGKPRKGRKGRKDKTSSYSGSNFLGNTLEGGSESASKRLNLMDPHDTRALNFGGPFGSEDVFDDSEDTLTSDAESLMQNLLNQIKSLLDG